MTRILAPVLLLIFLIQPALAIADTWEGDSDYEGERHGTWTRKYNDTDTSEIYNYRHGVRHGVHISYHASGQKFVEMTYRDDQRHGAYASFHDNEGNTPFALGTYTDDQMSGDWAEWHPNGQKKSETTYFNGELHGMAEVFYPSGGWQEVVLYRDGQQTGIYTGFYDNGDNTQKSSGNLRNGRMYGKWTAWHSNGEISAITEYVGDVRHGAVATWHPNSQRFQEAVYLSDVYHGPYTEYFPNEENTKRYSGAYHYGERIGVWREWGEDGTLLSEITYQSNRKNGPASYFNPDDGSPSYTTTYMDDEEHGLHEAYHWPRPMTEFDPLAAAGDSQEPAPYDLVEERGQNRSGQRVGEWTYTDIDGALILSTLWKNGVRHGQESQFYSNADNTPQEHGFWTDGWKTHEWTTWHDNGEMASRGSYASVGDDTVTGSAKSGAWGYFNRHGELTRVVVYENDEVVSEQVNCDHEGVTCD